MSLRIVSNMLIGAGSGMGAGSGLGFGAGAGFDSDVEVDVCVDVLLELGTGFGAAEAEGVGVFFGLFGLLVSGRNPNECSLSATREHEGLAMGLSPLGNSKCLVIFWFLASSSVSLCM
ncbi:Uncharacterised protein [Corynebacterium kutscheri]|uniref:Uncharacterized protein n=1 Tax=Corynebacterium kutscheri TaxID=35755 RepID=A0A0F6R0V6_9CORY|nr:hypothetical protein [Corynebacterium kutscheri]AKE41932.1 hypothetical protein UL82_08925 [Corynebacterium kutscheri]VEH06432.1 Uncharacterised protein [Corynebacterium kutscheri]VEH10267.1 Uncharacterised protein [Corynebacterium kutscheri]VEH82349.1 Uncharacterised protein [Corynebacterium kutscheri]